MDDDLEPTATMVSSVNAHRKARVIRPHNLEQEEGAGAPASYPLDADRILLGRSDSADIQIRSVKASRQHAVIERRGAEYLIRDNDSRNGIYLNGLRVNSAILREGDVVQVTDHVFVYHER